MKMERGESGERKMGKTEKRLFLDLSPHSSIVLASPLRLERNWTQLGLILLT